MRQLKFHEAKLLRKVDFLAWKSEGTLRELALLRRYHIGEREDYARYNRLAGYVTSLVAKLRLLPPEQRDVLLLVALEELSYQEVAAVLQIPPGTVMSRLSRARHLLAVALRPEATRSLA